MHNGLHLLSPRASERKQERECVPINTGVLDDNRCSEIAGHLRIEHPSWNRHLKWGRSEHAVAATLGARHLYRRGQMLDVLEQHSRLGELVVR